MMTYFLFLSLLLPTIGQVEIPLMAISITRQGKGALSVEDKISQAIKGLGSKDDGVRNLAHKKLLEVTKESIEIRSMVIHALLKVLERQETSFQAWSVAAEILGELKSTEAIDPLVKQLDRNDGTVGLAASRVPALRAIIGIGRPAVPKLAIALSKSNPSVRQIAAQALGAIGGREATTVLEGALKTEKDEQVLWYIRSALSNQQQK